MGVQIDYTMAPASYRGTATTNGSGVATFTFPVGRFGATPVAVATPGVSGNTNLIDCRISALTATSCTVVVQQSLAVTLLGVGVLEVKTPASGVPVQLIAMVAG